MKILPKWWSKYFLQVEFTLAVMITLGIIVWAEAFQGRLWLNEVLTGQRHDIYITLASIFGALLGFTITTESIVLGYATNARLAIVREAKSHEQLWRIFMSAIRVLGFGTLLALIGLIMDSDVHPGWWCTYLTIFVVILASFRLMRCIWVLDNIIKIVAVKPETDKLK